MKDWMKEYDKRFFFYDECDAGVLNIDGENCGGDYAKERVKDYIRSLLSTQHQEDMKKVREMVDEQKKDWELEFESSYGGIFSWMQVTRQNEVKAFIRSLLSTQHQEYMKKVREKLDQWVESKNWSAVFSESMKETVKKELDDLLSQLEEV